MPRDTNLCYYMFNVSDDRHKARGVPKEEYKGTYTLPKLSYVQWYW